MIIRRLYSRHTPKDLKEYRDLSEKRFNEDSEKKNSGFSWGKALGATAAVAGTMYGAKKGLLGNSIRRGYNTAYGHVGNALGSKSMIQSAANDYARGTNPQSRADFRKAYGKFQNKFDLTKGYKTTAPKTAQEAGMKTLDEIKNSSAAVSPAPVVKPVEPVQAVAPAAAPAAAVSADTTAKAAVKNATIPAAPSIFDEKKAEIRARLGTYKNQGPTTIKEMNQETAQRAEIAKRSNYQQSKKRKKITAQEQQQRINKVQQTLGKNQYNSKNPNSKGFNVKKPEVSVAATADDFYNNPYNEFRMSMYSRIGELKNQRFFSKKEDSSRKKKIKNAALLGAGTAGLGALTIYGIKNQKNRRVN